ncbi:hypothetical protein [Asticcacaulis sp. AC466]|uniref:hypothetical protein n=1 Tax=Asticcacaulis sp. AC466 TaxID=1282362 RepID=UPI0012DEDA9E|nr:hypothetical protein [Asticcacaulis sp. AC466]
MANLFKTCAALVALPLAFGAAQATPAIPGSDAGVAEQCLKTAESRLAPADLLQRLDDFRDSLSGDKRAKLDQALPRAADGGIARCSATDTSRASCENGAYLKALKVTGLLPDFATTICPVQTH